MLLSHHVFLHKQQTGGLSPTNVCTESSCTPTSPSQTQQQQSTSSCPCAMQENACYSSSNESSGGDGTVSKTTTPSLTISEHGPKQNSKVASCLRFLRSLIHQTLPPRQRLQLSLLVLPRLTQVLP